MAAREKGGFWVNLAAAVFYPVTTLLAKQVVIDGSRLPRTSGALLVMNHLSHLDPVYDAVCVHKLRRVPRFLAKHTLFERKGVGALMRGSGQIPVYRGSTKAGDSLVHARAALERGGIVVIYPEGTITKDPDGWPMVSRNGIARLALDTGVPVIPVARWGTLSILDPLRRRFRPFPRGTVTYRFGEPIDVSPYQEGRVTASKLKEITTLAMTRVRDMLAEIRGEPAPEDFYAPEKQP